MSKTKVTHFNFEKTLEQLNHLVEKMETGGLTLEESLKSFEEGISLTRQCQQALQAAEQKVKILLEKNGTAALEPYLIETEE